MPRLFAPGTGPAWLPEFSRSVLDLFKSRLERPFWLWGAPTADLPTDARMGANPGAAAWDETLAALAVFDGSAWGQLLSLTFGDGRYVARAGGAMTGALVITAALAGGPGVEIVDTTSPGTGSGGIVKVRTSAKPTAGGQRIGVVHFAATDSAAAVQNAAAIEAFSGADWGSLASEETYLTIGVTAAGALVRAEVLRLTGALATFAIPAKLPSFAVAGVPSAAALGAGTMIFVSNESGGAVVAFSDGTNWRRVTDRAVIS